MARFKFTGDIETTFHDLIHAGDETHTEGSTVVAQPGEEFDVKQVKSDLAVLNPDLEAVDDAAKKIVANAAEKVRLEDSRVFGTPAPVDVTEGVPVPTEAPAEPEPAPAPVEPAPAAPEAPAAAPETALPTA